MAQTVKRLSIMRETWVQSLEDPLEKVKTTHSSILALEIPWTEKPGRLQSMRSQRVGHEWSIWAHTHTSQGGEHRGSHQRMCCTKEREASLPACPSHLLSVPPSIDCYRTVSIHGDTVKKTSFAMIIVSFILRFMPMNYSQHKKGNIYMASKIFMLY